VLREALRIATEPSPNERTTEYPALLTRTQGDVEVPIPALRGSAVLMMGITE
jgi:hypothetical protein